MGGQIDKGREEKRANAGCCLRLSGWAAELGRGAREKSGPLLGLSNIVKRGRERVGLRGEKEKNGSQTEGRGKLGHAGRKGERVFFFSFSSSFLFSNPNSNMV